MTKPSRGTAALAISLAILTAAVLRSGGNSTVRTGDQEKPAGPARTAEPEVPARTAGVDAVSPRLRLLVPAYFYPAGQGLEEWERLLKGGARAPITVVVNPNSGPGDVPDPLYGAIIRRAVSQGLTPIGYVSTDYAKRPLEQVRSDIETWVRFYPEIRGIFFDSQASGPEHLAYYVQLRKLVAAKIPREVVVTNPGVLCSEDYFIRSAMDAACVFEYPEGFHQFHLPPWAAHYPPDRFSVLPYRIGEPEAMREVVSRAIKGRIGAIYVTDASGENPWSRLPRYWEAEVEAVHRVNQRQAP